MRRMQTFLMKRQTSKPVTSFHFENDDAEEAKDEEVEKFSFIIEKAREEQEEREQEGEEEAVLKSEETNTELAMFRLLGNLKACPARYLSIGFFVRSMKPKTVPERTFCFLMSVLLDVEVPSSGVLTPQVKEGVIIDERRCTGMHILNFFPMPWTSRLYFLLLMAEEILTNAARKEYHKKIPAPVELRRKLVTSLEKEVCSLCLAELTRRVLVPKCGHALHLGCLQSLILMSNDSHPGKCRSCLADFYFGNKIVRQYLLTLLWAEASVSVRKLYADKDELTNMKEVGVIPRNRKSCRSKMESFVQSNDRIQSLSIGWQSRRGLLGDTHLNDFRAERRESEKRSKERKEEEKNALNYLARRIAEEVDVSKEPILLHLEQQTEEIYEDDFYDFSPEKWKDR